ncbi:MAG: hypothetical protein ACKOE6_02030 [Flammeovirgaceae bacterium]
MDAKKGLSNVNVNSRLKQIAVLVVVILIGVLISNSLQAQNFHRAKVKHYKAKYRTQIKGNAHACDVLAKKRSKQPKQPLLSFLKSKPKYKPQAEVDAPAYVRTAKNSTANRNKILMASAE